MNETTNDANVAPEPVPSPSEAKLSAILDAQAAVRKANGQVYKYEASVEEAKGCLKAAEKRRDELVCELLDVIDGQGRLTFSGTATLAPGDVTAAPAEEAWRSVSIDQIGLPEKLASSLIEAEIKTIGALADYTKEHELTDLPGIGPAKAEKIQNAMEAYWKEHPQTEQTEQTEPAEQEESVPAETPETAEMLEPEPAATDGDIDL